MPTEVNCRAAMSHSKPEAFSSCLFHDLEKQDLCPLLRQATPLSQKRKLSRDVTTSAVGCCDPQFQVCVVFLSRLLHDTEVCFFC